MSDAGDAAARLARALGLEPHPEGGLFREVHRAARRVAVAPDGARRSAATSIYYLLRAGERSRWHRVASDEVWHFHEGDPLELWILDPALASAERRVLSPCGAPGEPLAVVPGGCWQAARTTGGHTLVSCTVAPGFEYEDWTLMAAAPEAERLRALHPRLAELL